MPESRLQLMSARFQHLSMFVLRRVENGETWIAGGCGRHRERGILSWG